MAERLTRSQIAQKATIRQTAVPHVQATVDRNFELPLGLYVATALGYLGFLALMTLGFGNPGLIVPMGIIVVFVAMFFGVNAMWMRMKPEHPQTLTSWARFQRQGIMTAYGRTGAGAATVQVVILPVLILVWGFAVVTIAALVR